MSEQLSWSYLREHILPNRDLHNFYKSARAFVSLREASILLDTGPLLDGLK